MALDEVLDRLRACVNREICEKHYTIKGFSVRCGVSYEEMRLIVNGRLKDVRLSTIFQICENSEIQIIDIFYENEVESIVSGMVLLNRGSKYRVRLLRYR